MAPLKQKGDLAEMMVAADLVRRGYRIAWPHGEDWDFDLVLYRDDRFERVQVKYTESHGQIVVARCRTQSLTSGKVMSVKHDTSAIIDWLAIYDRTSDCCYYIPAVELGEGMHSMTLRLAAARNGQRRGVRLATDYLDPGSDAPPATLKAT